jgi:hypothetical protein
VETGPTTEDDRRRARREFIRTHHPDVGGDHAHFVAGLAEHAAAPKPDPNAEPDPDVGDRPTATSPPRVTVTPDQPWPVSITTALMRRARRHRRPPRVR